MALQQPVGGKLLDYLKHILLFPAGQVIVDGADASV